MNRYRLSPHANGRRSHWTVLENDEPVGHIIRSRAGMDRPYWVAYDLEGRRVGSARHKASAALVFIQVDTP